MSSTGSASGSLEGKLVNKSQLIDALAARFEGNRKQAAHALESVLDTITREVAKGEKVAITGFGSFEKRIREARWVRNPQTGARMKAKKKAVPKFSAGAGPEERRLRRQEAAEADGWPPAEAASRRARGRGRRRPRRPPRRRPRRRPGEEGGPAKKAAPAKKAPGEEGAAKKAPAKKAAPAEEGEPRAKKAPAKKATGQEGPAKKTPPRRRRPAKKAAPAKKAPAKKAPAKKAAAKKS